MTITDSDRKQASSKWWSIHEKGEYTCPDCGRREDAIDRWEVHHINKQEDTIVGLCNACHLERHGWERGYRSVEEWKDGFEDALIT